MFGYVYPLESELKVKEQTLYKAAYCGLCRSIGSRYGLSARMALNYDCTFLALFLQALSGTPVPRETFEEAPDGAAELSAREDDVLSFDS